MIRPDQRLLACTCDASFLSKLAVPLTLQIAPLTTPFLTRFSMTIKTYLLSALVLFVSSLPAAPALSIAHDESVDDMNARMAWWRDARFGMFVHWGLYAKPAGIWKGEEIEGIGEWIMNHAKIPVSEYAALASGFNPLKFDADRWVQLAKEAGMKYIIITAKHHDGFAMFESAASDFNIVDATPFKRDPLKELAAACARHGIKLGIYYSQAQDWHHAGGSAMKGGHWDPAQEGSMDEYLDRIAYPQIKELLTNYGPVGVLWWDTPHQMTRERAAKLAQLLALQPGIITNNRLGGGFPGDTETPEKRVPATGYPRDWEACMTMNNTWGFKSTDHAWKSSQKLIRTLVEIASKGGNLLLNVGPTELGEVPEESVVRLREIGRWMERNGAAIYGTSASPFRHLDWGRATRKGRKLYLHVFDWPADGRLIIPMRGTPESAYLLHGNGAPLAFSISEAGLELEVPRQAPDAIASVVVLDGIDDPAPLPAPPQSAAADGSFALAADAADLTGDRLAVTGNLQLQLTGWDTQAASASWYIEVPEKTHYDVIAFAQYGPDARDSKFELALGETILIGTAPGGVSDQFEERRLGAVLLPAGKYRVCLRATDVPSGDFVALRTLILRPMRIPEAR